MIPRDRDAALTGALLGWSAAQTPGALPRDAALSAAAGLIAACLGLGIGLLVERGRTALGDRPGGGHRAERRFGPKTAATVAAAALALTVCWQSALRGAMGMAPIGPEWWAATVAVPAGAVAALMWVRPRRGTIVALAVLLVAGGAGTLPGTVPAARAEASSHLLLYAPLAGPPPSGIDMHDDDPPDIDPYDDARAARLVDRWIREGGLRERAVVIAVPTGSGWIDAAALDGFRRRFDGSVRVLALQYSAVPSWQAYLRSPDRAGRSATALTMRVLDALAAVPAPGRPRVHLYGQSLGAVGAEVARRRVVARGTTPASTVLVGMPGGAPRTAPATVVVENPSDPVVVLRPSLVWRPPTRRGSPHRFAHREAPTPPWLPGLSALATVIDAAGSLDVPVGYGHRYGPEQGLVQPSIGPRAAS
ncbi:MAG: alpha/beta-hydrolase family protein [Gordonia sp. (in: high G+C Gram-positive bacteria)]|uniref:alpha/beta-hydrolase family protein n=1 Tax=Gordonia sp. (in: high G+C Gram-positive bacteria) TaxID=84139 RepID=UPI0039E51BB8